MLYHQIKFIKAFAEDDNKIYALYRYKFSEFFIVWGRHYPDEAFAFWGVISTNTKTMTEIKEQFRSSKHGSERFRGSRTEVEKELYLAIIAEFNEQDCEKLVNSCKQHEPI